MTDIINYIPIRGMLESQRDILTNGFNHLSKDQQAQVDHIDTILESYERILEDLDVDGLAANSAELNELSISAVRLLLDIGTEENTLSDVDADELLTPITFEEMEALMGEDDADDREATLDVEADDDENQ